jgi:histidinol-phosphatase (PHP family)
VEGVTRMPWANLHTHTWRCQHASGDVIDYARVAAASGMPVFGMADHSPLPDGRWQDHRMRPNQLDDYMAAVELARREVPAVRILLGMECDWDPDFAGFYREELLGRRGFDYLLVGCHLTPSADGERIVPNATTSRWFDTFNTCTTPARLRAYAAHAEATMASGLFVALTHPDLIGMCQQHWTADTAACARDICQASVALGVALEMNSYGVRKPWVPGTNGERPGYPWEPFWEVAADCGVRVVLSSDAHRPQDLCAGYDHLTALRDRLGLREAELPFLAPR